MAAAEEDLDFLVPPELKEKYPKETHKDWYPIGRIMELNATGHSYDYMPVFFKKFPSGEEEQFQSDVKKYNFYKVHLEELKQKLEKEEKYEQLKLKKQEAHYQELKEHSERFPISTLEIDQKPDVIALCPFDVYINGIVETLQLSVDDYPCNCDMFNERSSSLNLYLNKYASKKLLLDDFFKFESENPTIHFLDSKWQAESSGSTFHNEKFVPTVNSAITAYRGYRFGIDHAIVDQGVQMFDDRLRSLTLSQTFMRDFTQTKKINDKVRHARVDILRGVKFVPLLKYNAEGIYTEFEIVVKIGRVHVFPKDTVYEGTNKCEPVKIGNTKDCIYNPNPLEEIDYYFIISNPGDELAYCPNYYELDEDEEKVVYSINSVRSASKTGGGKGTHTDRYKSRNKTMLRLTDKNAIGVGNVSEIMDAYMYQQERKNENDVRQNKMDERIPFLTPFQKQKTPFLTPFQKQIPHSISATRRRGGKKRRPRMKTTVKLSERMTRSKTHKRIKK